MKVSRVLGFCIRSAYLQPANCSTAANINVTELEENHIDNTSVAIAPLLRCHTIRGFEQPETARQTFNVM